MSVCIRCGKDVATKELNRLFVVTVKGIAKEINGIEHYCPICNLTLDTPYTTAKNLELYGQTDRSTVFTKDKESATPAADTDSEQREESGDSIELGGADMDEDITDEYASGRQLTLFDF